VASVSRSGSGRVATLSDHRVDCVGRTSYLFGYSVGAETLFVQVEHMSAFPSVDLRVRSPRSGNVPFRVLFRSLSSLRRLPFPPNGHRHHGTFVTTTPMSRCVAPLFATVHSSRHYPSSSSSGTSTSS